MLRLLGGLVALNGNKIPNGNQIGLYPFEEGDRLQVFATGAIAVKHFMACCAPGSKMLLNLKNVCVALLSGLTEVGLT
ncbi:MAG: hypothetical protein VKJ64_02065 [Leptolyngbyaceae bacterium]|nr:hypothetical protein [Leptolyngbyaceae bacterium]